MKVVILAGGFGTRISEESISKPKPMVEINGTPLIIHLMRSFYEKGYNDFIICGGYKCDYLKKYFSEYKKIMSDLEINSYGEIKYLEDFSEKWNVKIIDTGLNTQTAGRIKKIEKYIDDDRFILTYGDGISNININDVIDISKKTNKLVTLSAYLKKSKFGDIKINDSLVESFSEKKNSDSWINIGFMVIKKEIFNFISNDDSLSFEFDILPKLVNNKEVAVFKFFGYWKCMDTLKDKLELEKDLLGDKNG